jgi:hypothetical protein
MAKIVEKKSKRAAAKTVAPVAVKAAPVAVKAAPVAVKAAPVTKKIVAPVAAPVALKAAPAASVKKAATKKKTVKALVRGKIVKADMKGKKKHELKKTGEVIRFEQKKHPERAGSHHVLVHGKEVEGGLQLVTPAAQASIAASLRSRPSIASGSEFAFAGPKDFLL